MLLVLIYGAYWGLTYLCDNRWFNMGSATLLLLLFTLFVGKIERKELEKMPFIGRFLRTKPV
jgi:hypothetical protein